MESDTQRYLTSERVIAGYEQQLEEYKSNHAYQKGKYEFAYGQEERKTFVLIEEKIT